MAGRSAGLRPGPFRRRVHAESGRRPAFPEPGGCAGKTAETSRLSSTAQLLLFAAFYYMKADIHPKYVDAEIRCACGNIIKTRSTKPTVIVGICNNCHPFYTGQQKFVDTAGRVDKFQQRAAKTAAAAEAFAAKKKKK